MSVECLAAVLHHSRAKGTAKLVLIGVANHAGDGGAWPSVSTLARYAGVTERNVQKALHQLVQLGELAVHQQAGGTSSMRDWERPNRYDVLVACPATCDRSAQHRLRLPQADAQLWKQGVSQATGGVATDRGGVSQATPGGVSLPTPEPSRNLTPGHRSESVTGPRASSQAGQADQLTCDECWQPESVCRAAAATNGHSFTPRKAS